MTPLALRFARACKWYMSDGEDITVSCPYCDPKDPEDDRCWVEVQAEAAGKNRAILTISCPKCGRTLRRMFTDTLVRNIRREVMLVEETAYKIQYQEWYGMDPTPIARRGPLLPFTDWPPNDGDWETDDWYPPFKEDG